MTALIIITGQLLVDVQTGHYVLNEAGRIATASGTVGRFAITSGAMGPAFSWAPVAPSAAVVPFVSSTMISRSYYGMKART